MKRIKLFFTVLSALMGSALALAQDLTVTGVVTDSSTGEPVPFATIQVKGTLNGGSTDAAGNYSILVEDDAVLIFSSIGYVSQEIEVSGKASIDVSLHPDSELLDETIVVAYGTAKKSSFTGSAGTVGSSNLAKRSVTNVSKAIEGMVAGITVTSGSGQPGSSSSINIRGTGSINASSQPLYVVDGVVEEVDIVNGYLFAIGTGAG